MNKMKLNFISDIKKSHKSCRKYDGVKRYIETGNVQETKIVGFEEYTYDKKPSRAGVCVSAGTVLVAKMQNSIKVLLIDKETENYIYSTGFYAFKDERILPTFLKYFFLSSYFNYKKDIKCTGGTQKAINDEGMKQICISVPSFEEQEAISDYLDTKCAEIDSICENIITEINTLEEYKKSVITETVTRGLHPDVAMKDSGIEWIGEIPEHWKLIKGKYIFTLRNQCGNTKNLELLSSVQKYGIIPQTLYEEITGMSPVKLSEKTNLSKFKTIHIGDYCISLRSFQGGFEYSRYEGVVSPAYQVFYPIIEISGEYYKYLFKEQNFIDIMTSYTLTLRDGKVISYADFGNTYIPYPDVNEQKSIATYLDDTCSEIDTLIQEKKEQLTTLSEYKKSLIYEYVTGKKTCTLCQQNENANDILQENKS